MRKSVTILALALAFALAGAEARAQCRKSFWLSDPPTKVYRDGNLRFHFITAGFTCNPQVSKMDGTHVSPDGVECVVNNHQYKGLEVFQDWRPVSGTWGSPRTFSLPLSASGIDGTCYDETTGATPLTIEVLDAAAPAAQKVAVTVKDAIIAWNCQTYIGLGITPVDRETIYWVTVQMQAYKETLPYMVDLKPPYPLPDGPNTENIVYIELHKGGCHTDQCNEVFQTELCTPIVIWVQAEDLAGRTSEVSEPASVMLGVPNPQGYDWRLGDPLGCEAYDGGFLDGGNNWDIGVSDFDVPEPDGGSVESGAEPADDNTAACSCSTLEAN